jgi:hypothetical protein
MKIEKAVWQSARSIGIEKHAFPTLLTLRNSLPRAIAAKASRSSISLLTQSGTGTVRTWPPLPTRSTMAQMLLPQIIQMSKPRLHLSSTHTRAVMRARLGPVSFQPHTIGCLPKGMALLRVNQFPRRMPSFLTPLTRRMPTAKSAEHSHDSCSSLCVSTMVNGPSSTFHEAIPSRISMED